MLIFARALQGVGGGGLMQLVYIVISDVFSVRRRAKYIGLLGLMWAVAGSAGPLVGGALSQLASWRYVVRAHFAHLSMVLTCFAGGAFGSICRSAQ